MINKKQNKQMLDTIECNEEKIKCKACKKNIPKRDLNVLTNSRFEHLRLCRKCAHKIAENINKGKM